VGKLALLGVVAFICLAYMSRQLPSGQALVAFIIAAVTVLVVVGSILLIAFRRPELAVLEGTELIAYKRITQAAKDYNPDRELPPIPDPSKQLEDGAKREEK